MTKEEANQTMENLAMREVELAVEEAECQKTLADVNYKKALLERESLKVKLEYNMSERKRMAENNLKEAKDNLEDVKGVQSGKSA